MSFFPARGRGRAAKVDRGVRAKVEDPKPVIIFASAAGRGSPMAYQWNESAFGPPGRNCVYSRLGVCVCFEVGEMSVMELKRCFLYRVDMKIGWELVGMREYWLCGIYYN